MWSRRREEPSDPEPPTEPSENPGEFVERPPPASDAPPVKDSPTKQTQKRTTTKKAVEPSKSAAVWERYRSAYFTEYRCDPVRDAAVNRMLCKLVDILGADVAPFVAEFFLSHKNSYYIQRGHAVECLVRDARKLHTEWVTGKRINATMARQHDKMESRGTRIILRRMAEEEALMNGKATIIIEDAKDGE
jgi:hypothetical protein